MVKPRWLLAVAALLASAGLAGAVVIASPGGEEEAVQQVDSPTPTATVAASTSPTPSASPEASVTPAEGGIPSTTFEPTSSPTPTAAPGEVLFRWANVTLLFTPGQGIFLFATWLGPDIKPPSGGPGIEVILDRHGTRSGVFVDAETAEILMENVRPEDRPALNTVLGTRSVSPLDRSTAPWPYNGEPGPDAVRQHSSRISFIEPPLQTGLHVYEGVGDPGGPFISMKNERSHVFVQIDITSGVSWVDTSAVVAEDAAAFERWLTSLKRCDVEIQC